MLLGGAAGGFVGPDRLDLELSFEATRAAGATLGSGVIMLFDDTVDLVPVLLRIAAFFRDESCGQCVPCRVGTVRQQEALLRLASERPRGSVEDELALLAEIAPGDARRVDLRPRPDCGQRRRVGDQGISRCSPKRMSAVPVTLRRTVELEIDGEKVRVFEGSTILDACRARGDRDPDALLRRVADAGQRVPGLHGRGRGLARAGAVVRPQGRGRDGGSRPTPTASATAARWCSSSWVRASTSRPPRTPSAGRRSTTRGPSGTGRRRRPPKPACATPRGPGTTTPATARPRRPSPSLSRSTTRATSATTRSASSVTSASRAAATDWQNTFAIAVAGRGFDARIATEFATPLPDSACVYCGNCIAVCPTGALMFKSEYDMRADGTLGRGGADRHRDHLLLLRRRLQPRAARAGQRDRQGHLAARPQRHPRQPLREGPVRLPVRAEPAPRSMRCPRSPLTQLPRG